jgi:hypothetical protein
MKLNKEQQISVNRLTSTLGNMISECCKPYEHGNEIPDSMVLSYFSELMEDAGVNTDVTIAVLEDVRFGEQGKNEAVFLKIKNGY